MEISFCFISFLRVRICDNLNFFLINWREKNKKGTALFNCSFCLLERIVFSFYLVGRFLHCDDTCSISSAIFAVLYKIFDRHSGNNDLVFCKVVLFAAPIDELLAVKFDGCVDFCKLDLANKLGGFDDFASFCPDKFERCLVLRKRLNKTRT
ncbi:MAG: hypothetical protein M3R14_09470, partial [Acidobacteriota bacterium]|nr:hypothetical protein [Acidobacteriota bacterium]